GGPSEPPSVRECHRRLAIGERTGCSRRTRRWSSPGDLGLGWGFRTRGAWPPAERRSGPPDGLARDRPLRKSRFPRREKSRTVRVVVFRVRTGGSLPAAARVGVAVAGGCPETVSPPLHQVLPEHERCPP